MAESERHLLKYGTILASTRLPTSLMKSGSLNRKVLLTQGRLCLAFYTSTLSVNFTTSLIIALIVFRGLSVGSPEGPSFVVLYIRCCMFGGPFFCFMHKEMNRRNEYYFFFNQGISKLNLIATTVGTNIIGGTVLIYMLDYAKLT